MGSVVFRGRRRGEARLGLGRRISSALAVALVALLPGMARGEAIDDVIRALKIRDYLRASEAQCREAALARAQRQVAASVTAHLAGQAPRPEGEARIRDLSRTYAREACRLGIDEGLMQRYREVYRAALTESDLRAAAAFLSSPEGKNLVEAGLGANRAILPLIWRRQESQAARAAVLLQSRAAALLKDLSKDKPHGKPATQ